MDAPGLGRAVEELALRQLSPRPPARRPPPPPPVPLGAWPSLLPEAVACLFALLIQVTIWCSTASGLVLRGHLHQAMICAGFVGSYCIATSAAYTQSRFWQRCRPVVITTLRLLLGTVPANRSSTEGLASLLRRNGTPGVRGAVHDYFRFVTGTHVFLIAVGPPLLALPPLAALVLNAGLMALTHNSDYCGTQLLTHPLSQRRLRRAAGALDIVLQPPPSAVGAVVTKSAHALDDRQACVAVFTLQQTLLGVLLPALAASWVPRPPLPGPEPTAAAAAESEGEQAGGRLWRHAARRASRACKSVAEACERANDALLHFCRSVCTPTGKHLVGIWLLCCELWLLAKVVAAHSA